MYKISELRSKSREELLKLISELKGKLLALRFEAATGQLSETHLPSVTKKDIALIFTVLKEQELGIVREVKEETAKDKKVDKQVKEETSKPKEETTEQKEVKEETLKPKEETTEPKEEVKETITDPKEEVKEDKAEGDSK